MKKNKCCVIGLGYIGIPTSIVAASSGFNVVGVDIDFKIVESLNAGIIPIIEPNLDLAFKETIIKKTFKAQTKPCFADIFIIAVPTPFKNKQQFYPIPDTSFILNAIESIIPFLRKDNLILLESTSPVGTTEKVAKIIFEKSGLNQDELNIAYCPERVLPGRILQEIKENDRVIGGINEKSAIYAKNFYSNFCSGKFQLTNTKTAELVKLTENSFRDVNIAFANELSMICSEFGIDTNKLIDIANYHPRVNILKPGPGVGGHCIAVDPWFIVSDLPNQSILIRTAREVNNKKTEWVIEKIKNVADNFKNENKLKPIIGCFGLAFKPDIDDIRESSAMKIVENLISDNHDVICCDPNVSFVDNIKITSIKDLIKKSDILVFLVAHKEFKGLNIQNQTILDFCNALDKQ